MRIRSSARVTLAFTTATFFTASLGAEAQSVADFYKGRQMSMVIYTDAGGPYDVYGRLLGRHMGRHIPGGPTFIPQNMPGAGGLKAAEYLFRIAPKDGSVIGIVSRGMPFEPMLGQNPVKIDPMKYLWIGSMSRETSLAVSWHTSKVKTLDDLRTSELLVPGTGAGADSEIIPVAVNALAGTKFKIISGYRGTPAAALAMERGELEGLGYYSWRSIKLQATWLAEKKINLLFHTAKTEHPELKGVPMIRSVITDETSRKAMNFLLDREVLGRPIAGPPDIPADRAKALRDAFVATLKDPVFLADAAKGRIEVDIVPGEEVDALLKEAASAPPEVIAKVKQALGRK